MAGLAAFILTNIRTQSLAELVNTTEEWKAPLIETLRPVAGPSIPWPVFVPCNDQ
jgi:hypothetical protein